MSYWHNDYVLDTRGIMIPRSSMFIGTRNKQYVLTAMRNGYRLRFAPRPYVPALFVPAGGHSCNVHWDTIRELIRDRYIIKVSGDMRSVTNPAEFALTSRGLDKGWRFDSL